MGDPTVDLACGMIKRITCSVDLALDQAYMAGVLASDEDTNRNDGLAGRRPIPVQESIQFYETRLTVIQRPKVLQRAYNLLYKALKVYQELDSIEYEDNDDPEVKYRAFEYWLEEDTRAYNTIKAFREKLERSRLLDKEKLRIMKTEAQKRLGAYPKHSGPSIKPNAIEHQGPHTNNILAPTLTSSSQEESQAP